VGQDFLGGFIHHILKAEMRRHLKLGMRKIQEGATLCFQWQDGHFDHFGIPSVGHVGFLCLQPGLLYVSNSEKLKKQESSSRNCEWQ